MIKLFFKTLIYISYKLIELIEYVQYRKMNLNELDARKKVLKTISNCGIKLNTDNGIRHASEMHLTQPFNSYEIELENNLKLECADTHIVYDEYFNQKFVYDLIKGDVLQTKEGLSKVVKVKKLKRKVSMFDISVDTNEHRYYTNGILSHNTINSAISILHFVTFNNDKNVMIVANVASTTTEIVDKIKNIYILLPFFLKVGIKNWTTKHINFSNGCRIKSSARSRTPAIGFTIDFLYMDEFAHIDSNIIEPYYTAVIPTVASIKGSKVIISSTPNGMNLFYRLLMSAEKPEGDPDKSEYVAKRIYWYQVPGRFTTIVKLNPHKMKNLDVTVNDLYEKIKEKYGNLTKVGLETNDGVRYEITIDNANKKVSEDDVREFVYFDKKTNTHISIFEMAEVTTWKKNAIKTIGGEDAFNQEYNLRFINASRSLLSEESMEALVNKSILYKFREFKEMDNKLKFNYEGLSFIDSIDINELRNFKGVISVDIAEGLGLDYSVINMFKFELKDEETVALNIHKYTNLTDFVKLEQFGIFRSNHVSVKQLAELFYILAFEILDPDNFKVVLELNNYGNEFLAHLPYLFDGYNEYGSFIFFNYKHRIDAEDENIGLKVNNNKKLLIKDYQTRLGDGSIDVNNSITIDEISKFVKHETNAGNVRYCADIGHDDTVMTVVNLATVFEKEYYKQMVLEYLDTEHSDKVLEMERKIENNLYKSESKEEYEPLHGEISSFRDLYSRNKYGSLRRRW